MRTGLAMADPDATSDAHPTGTKNTITVSSAASDAPRLAAQRFALVLYLRRRALRGRQPPCGTESASRSFMMRREDCSRRERSSGLRRMTAGPVMLIITFCMPSCGAGHASQEPAPRR